MPSAATAAQSRGRRISAPPRWRHGGAKVAQVERPQPEEAQGAPCGATKRGRGRPRRRRPRREERGRPESAEGCRRRAVSTTDAPRARWPVRAGQPPRPAVVQQQPAVAAAIGGSPPRAQRAPTPAMIGLLTRPPSLAENRGGRHRHAHAWRRLRLRRTGLALSSASRRCHCALSVRGRLGRRPRRRAREVARAAAGEGAAQIVLGMPLNSTGGEGEQATVTREVARVLAAAAARAASLPVGRALQHLRGARPRDHRDARRRRRRRRRHPRRFSARPDARKLRARRRAGGGGGGGSGGGGKRRGRSQPACGGVGVGSGGG